MNQWNTLLLTIVGLACALLPQQQTTAQQTTAQQNVAQQAVSTPEKQAVNPPATPDLNAPGVVALNPAKTLFLEKEKQRLLLKTEVVLQEGVLELFCCLKGTKHHESILAWEGEAFLVHTGLLALGCQPGKPVQFGPEFQPPTGQKLDLFINWTVKGKAHRVNARQWMQTVTRRYFTAKLAQLPSELATKIDPERTVQRPFPESIELKYDSKNHELYFFGSMTKQELKQLQALSVDKVYQKAIQNLFDQSQPSPFEANWVFAGSGTWKDEKTGKAMYDAEVGDLICVSNFPSATIDVAQQSSASQGEWLYESKSSVVPPLGTKVILEIIKVK